MGICFYVTVNVLPLMLADVNVVALVELTLTYHRAPTSTSDVEIKCGLTFYQYFISTYLDNNSDSFTFVTFNNCRQLQTISNMQGSSEENSACFGFPSSCVICAVRVLQCLMGFVVTSTTDARALFRF